MRLSRHMLLILAAVCFSPPLQAQPSFGHDIAPTARARAAMVEAYDACTSLLRSEFRPGEASAPSTAPKEELAFCDQITYPDAWVIQVALVSGAISAVLTVFGMIAFAYLGGIMRRLWRAE